MEPTTIAALIAAAAAVTGLAGTQYTTYRLKLKEFRVTQIAARVAVLEQALSFEASSLSSPISDKEMEPLDEAIRGILLAVTNRVIGTDKVYTRCKWLLNSQYHDKIDPLQKQSNELFGKFLLTHATDPRTAISKRLPAAATAAEDFQKAYEAARLATIERLYAALNADIGV